MQPSNLGPSLRDSYKIVDIWSDVHIHPSAQVPWFANPMVVQTSEAKGLTATSVKQHIYWNNQSFRGTIYPLTPTLAWGSPVYSGSDNSRPIPKIFQSWPITSHWVMSVLLLFRKRQHQRCHWQCIQIMLQKLLKIWQINVWNICSHSKASKLIGDCCMETI